MACEYYLAGCRLDGQSGHDAGRDLLRQLYKAHVGGELPPILHGSVGKPYFADSPWHFSITHTRHHAFCVLAPQPVGIDAEEIGREMDLRLIHRFLSPAEAQRISSAANPQDALLRLWVLKESYAKLTGRGIGNYLKNTDFFPNDPRIQIIDGCYVAILEE